MITKKDIKAFYRLVDKSSYLTHTVEVDVEYGVLYVTYTYYETGENLYTHDAIIDEAEGHIEIHKAMLNDDDDNLINVTEEFINLAEY